MNCNVLKNGRLIVIGCLFGVLFALLPTVAAAQGLEVTAPLSLTSRQEAVQYERYDYNLNRCAVVVVYLDDDNVDFQGDVRSTQYRGNGEWWVWMIQGASWMSVTVPSYTPLRMEFNPLASGKTYEVRIRPAAPKLLLTVAEPFHADISMTDASKYSRLDAKGRTCALVRIGMVLPEAQFSGVEHSKYLNSEWMVWLSPGSTSLTISAQGYQPLTVQFEPVQAAVTYLMTVHKAGEMFAQKQRPSSANTKTSKPNTEPLLQRTDNSSTKSYILLVQSGIQDCRRGYFKKAHAEFLAAAQKGDEEGCYQLGMLYLDEKFDGADYDQAYKWLTKAAEMGHKKAADKLRNMPAPINLP